MNKKDPFRREELKKQDTRTRKEKVLHWLVAYCLLRRQWLADRALDKGKVLNKWERKQATFLYWFATKLTKYYD